MDPEPEGDPVESTPAQPNPQMSIDLSLAVNYAPAVLCLLRLGFFQLLACVIQAGDEAGGFTMLAMLLWLDRVCCKVYLDGYTNMIFDSNAVLLSVYFSDMVMFVRTIVPDAKITFFAVLVYILWGLVCFLLTLEPSTIRQAFERRSRLYHVAPAVLTVVALMVVIRIHAPKEDYGLKFLRAYSFAILSIVWIYGVGLHQTRSSEYLRDSSSLFVSRFAPCLFVPAPLSVVFSILSLVCIGYQAHHLFTPATPLPQQDPEQPTQSSARDDQAAAQSPPDDDLVEMFRKAKSARGQ